MCLKSCLISTWVPLGGGQQNKKRTLEIVPFFKLILTLTRVGISGGHYGET